MLIESHYKSPFPWANGHLDTLIPYFFRSVDIPNYQRQRVATNDGDFLDLDWLKNGNSKLVDLSHGLEGSSRSKYICGQAHSLQKNGFDVLAWNFRGCSGEPNKLRKMYHSGSSDDLDCVLSFVLSHFNYRSIFLLGFSMGGNITLKYLAEKGQFIDTTIKKALVFSVPICLESCANHLARGFNKNYTKSFIKTLVKKMKESPHKYSDFQSKLDWILSFKTFHDFDQHVTAKINGFGSALDYWQKASTVNRLHEIHLKTLVVNALNDPFLGDHCYPKEVLKKNSCVDLEVPLTGGHVGFALLRGGSYWSELRALEYFEQT